MSDTWDDVDDDEPRDYDGMTDREPYPLFGCACQNPLTVDDCCPACIAWLQEQP